MSGRQPTENEHSLICDSCGYESRIESITGPDGEALNAAEYTELTHKIGVVLLCDSCSGYPELQRQERERLDAIIDRLNEDES